jgi:glycosyltransferase involved in cell wall biosynthesis
MNISIISCVFSPEPVLSARTSADLAQTLAVAGHNVRVIAPFPNRPAGKLYQGYRRSLWKWDRSDPQYEILRVFSWFSRRSNLLSRFLENISFGIASALAVLLLNPPNVIYANTWPLFAQGLLVLACKLRQIPLILSIQDLYPESLFIQKRGVEKHHFLYQCLRWLDVQIARHCAGLIVISEQFKQTYVKDRGIPENKVTLIPNWINESHSTSASTNRNVRQQYGIPEDAFLVVYGGNIGIAAGVEKIIDAFQYLTGDDHIYLLVAGGGHSLPNCFALIQKRQLTRVKVHSPWYPSETQALLSAADLCILPTQGEQSLVSVPSKLLSYMLAGRCILALASSQSETARVITTSQSGWVISSDDSISLAGYIRDISQLPSEERNKRGEAGGNFVHKHLSSSNNLPKVVGILVHYGKRDEKNPSYAPG